jgi:apolipoprotein D and lipocalin family protein
MRTTAVVILLAALTALQGCASMKAPMQTVQHVDLPKYMGDWYVIGEIPYFAEKDCYDSIESYALRADGDIDNWFTCRKKSFDAPMRRLVNARARVIDTTSNATWRVRFFKVFSVKYLILDLDPDYQWVMVGHPSRRYGWIMARTQTLPEPTYAAILQRTRQQGYDPDKFKKVPQRAATSDSGAH